MNGGFKAILVQSAYEEGEGEEVVDAQGSSREDSQGFYLSCIFSRMGTIMSNLGLLAGSSFMQILISLQMWGEMPGGMVGRRPSSATWRTNE